MLFILDPNSLQALPIAAARANPRRGLPSSATLRPPCIERVRDL